MVLIVIRCKQAAPVCGHAARQRQVPWLFSVPYDTSCKAAPCAGQLEGGGNGCCILVLEDNYPRRTAPQCCRHVAPSLSPLSSAIHRVLVILRHSAPLYPAFIHASRLVFLLCSLPSHCLLCTGFGWAYFSQVLIMTGLL